MPTKIGVPKYQVVLWAFGVYFLYESRPQLLNTLSILRGLSLAGKQGLAMSQSPVRIW